MKRRQFLAGTAGCAPAFVRRLSGQPRRPNILLITADDLGPVLSCYADDQGCYGEKLIQTPHLDRLAGAGVRFRTAYVAQASCSPSRSTMFTGLYVHSTGQFGLTNGGFRLHPPLVQATIPAVLKKAGYRTGIIGKLHVAPEDSFPFDYRNTNGAITRRVREAARMAGAFFTSTGNEPFFLMMNFSDPHAFRDDPSSRHWYFPPQVDGLPEKPLAPGPHTLFRFQQIDTPLQRERTANYHNAVKRLDDGIGMLMDKLREHRLEDKTVVLFVGDHGPPFTRGKTTVYEAGLRVPYIVQWPGVSKPGVSRAMVSTTDLAPTIFDAAGVSSPVTVHGQSLRPLLGGAEPPWRQYLAGEFHFHGPRPFFPRRAIRDGRYKLIHNLLAGRSKPSTAIDGDTAYEVSRQAQYEGTPVRRAFDTFADPPELELYDLQTDPVEFRNLAGTPAFRAIQQRLAQALQSWREQTRDPFLEPGMLEKMLHR